MIPPPATAATKASEVQLAGVPLPITVSGEEVSSCSASGGILHSAALSLVATGNKRIHREKIWRKSRLSQ
jgi:hypothetical protein